MKSRNASTPSSRILSLWGSRMRVAPCGSAAATLTSSKLTARPPTGPPLPAPSTPVTATFPWPLTAPPTAPLCTMSRRSFPPITACSMSYSTPSLRGQTTVKSPVGSAASSSQVSVVTLEPASIIRYLRLRVRPTPTQKRSSGSWKTLTSADAAVPSSCRQTVSGRQASSTVE